MKKEAWKFPDALSGLAFILLAALFCYFAWQMGLWSGDSPGDGFFPFVGGLALVFFSIILFLQTVLKSSGRRNSESTLKRKLAVYLGCFFGFVFFFERIGFILTAFFFVLVICKVAEKVGWKISIALAALSTAICMVIFYALLDVPLPFGVLKGLKF